MVVMVVTTWVSILLGKTAREDPVHETKCNLKDRTLCSRRDLSRSSLLCRRSRVRGKNDGSAKDDKGPK